MITTSESRHPASYSSLLPCRNRPVSTTAPGTTSPNCRQTATFRTSGSASPQHPHTLWTALFADCSPSSVESALLREDEEPVLQELQDGPEPTKQKTIKKKKKNNGKWRKREFDAAVRLCGNSSPATVRRIGCHA